MANAYVRIHAPEKLSRNPNIANLEEVESKTCKWEQTQRSLYRRHLERSQKAADGDKQAADDRVAFPKQLVHDLNVLRQRAAANSAADSGAATDGAAAAARPAGSGPTPGSGDSLGSGEQVC